MKRFLLILAAAFTLCVGSSCTTDGTASQTATTQAKKAARKVVKEATREKAKESKEEKEFRDNFKDIPADPKGEVYVTKTGEKYHVKGCVALEDRETKRVSKTKAQNAGLHACKKCSKRYAGKKKTK